jgi:hypothetical protein
MQIAIENNPIFHCFSTEAVDLISSEINRIDLPPVLQFSQYIQSMHDQDNNLRITYMDILKSKNQGRTPTPEDWVSSLIKMTSDIFNKACIIGKHDTHDLSFTRYLQVQLPA